MKRDRSSGLRYFALFVTLLPLACAPRETDGSASDAGISPDDSGADVSATSVEVGIPSGPDGLDFAPLPSQGELRLETFGQGGTHVLLGVRCIGFGHRAFVTLSLTNLETGERVVSPAPVQPQLLACDEAGEICDLVPVLAMATGIAAAGVERNGLHVEVAAEVSNQAGLTGSASQEAVLSTADL